MNRQILPIIFTAVSLAACARSSGGPAPVTAGARPADGADLVRLMHARYDGRWYRTLSFVQEVYFADGRPTETWSEAGMIPGKLRIDHEPVDSGNATIYSGDSAYVFARGKLVRARRDRNLLMTLGFDVYGQDPATTAAQLRAEGVNLDLVSEGTWQGRPVWIAGAAAGDTSVTQFWIEKERLLFVRLLQHRKGPNGQTSVLDAEFNKYQPLGRAWIAPEVVLRLNGKDYFREVYRDIKADPALPPDLYTTTEYRRPR